MQQIKSYFPQLSESQIHQFEQLGALYTEWNAKINVISRKDIDNLYERHVLHSLVISRFIRFHSGADILDLGTGGGFPGIPLAIFFPQTKFTLIDGTRKKIKVVQEVVNALGLDNVEARQVRAEELKKMKFDFVVSRAVAAIDQLMLWSQRLLKNQEMHALPNGLIALKGGRIQSEIKLLPRGAYKEIYPISDYFSEPFFKEKYLVYVQR
ncbi:MAG: 16S rRNA (guanine(527)-N(7))-methyltransferase RsmG [Bacteroidota bacterium]